MMKRRPRSACSSRGVQAVLAAACLALAGCAVEAIDEDDESLADEEMEEGTPDEPFDEPDDEEMEEAPAEPAEPEEAEPEDETAPEEEDEVEAACVGYGGSCTSSGACCGDMVCAFDGYARYCRN